MHRIRGCSLLTPCQYFLIGELFNHDHEFIIMKFSNLRYHTMSFQHVMEVAAKFQLEQMNVVSCEGRVPVGLLSSMATT